MTGPETPSQAAPGEPAPRILIVDDVEDNRAILGRRFQRRGFEVIEADGGAKALELIEQQPFDIVLLDWMMPGMDGIAVLKRIRETRTQVELPVIMATAKTQSEDVVEALTLGANDYITKPVDFAVALARVEAQIGRKKAEAELMRANAALGQMNEELERRIAERTVELVETNHRLQAANRSKDEFLTNMSHELRTPLNGVIGVAQMLGQSELNPKQRELLEVIDTSAVALQHVLTNLLDIVDLESGRIELNLEAFELGDLVRSAAAFPQMKAQQKGLDFSIEVSPEAEGQVESDPLRLRQLLLNLLSNALKFTDKGSIGLRVSRVPAAPEKVMFEVHDTGVGFEPGEAERLFKRFEQADGSLTRQFGGVGLGLSICRELVEKMGGTIVADGQPDKGAVFRVELPLPGLESAPGGEAGGEPEAEGRPVHVLCAEDHPVNRQVIEFILAAAGVGVTTVENGAEAVDAFRAQAFDAVLMDMQMPVMDGLTATKAIRDLEVETGRPATPVIMVTAHGLPEHVSASRAAGADRHVTKPVVAANLLNTLAECINGQDQEAEAQRAAG